MQLVLKPNGKHFIVNMSFSVNPKHIKRPGRKEMINTRISFAVTSGATDLYKIKQHSFVTSESLNMSFQLHFLVWCFVRLVFVSLRWKSAGGLLVGLLHKLFV